MEILYKPLVTEKMTEQSEKLNRFGFIVNRRATKDQIKGAVEQLYDVKVASVNTMVYGGKTKYRYTKSGVQKGKTTPSKKQLLLWKKDKQ
jgi:large subunit ribosomal protein L23